MKKIIFLLFTSIILTACGSYRSLDLGRLTTGMTKGDVEYVAGPPSRVLAVNQTKQGYQEVLEYRTSRSEVYALEFYDDYLVGYEFLYDDIDYVAPAPPLIMPDYGRPIVIIQGNNRPNHPNRPNRPSQPNRPNRPNQPNRPSEPNRPNRPGSDSRPSEPNRTTNRPAGTDGASTGRTR